MSASVRLATLDSLRAYMGIADDDASENELLDQMLDAASEAMETLCNRKFLAATGTEQYDGLGHDTVVLDRYPATSITSIHDDLERNFAAASLVAATDYTFRPASGIVVKVNGVFGDGIRNVKIIYVAGYAQTAIPTDLALGVRKWAAALWNKANEGADGIALERLADWSANYVLSMKPIPEDVLALASQYADLAVGGGSS